MADFVSQYSGPEIDEAVGKGLLLPTITAGDAGKPVVANPDEDGFTVGNSVIPSGTSMLFNQASAPTGWTKKTNWSETASVIVGNTYAAEAGSHNPVSYTTAVAVGNHATHTHSGPSHVHAGPNHNHSGPNHTHRMNSHRHDVVVPRTGWGAGTSFNEGLLATNAPTYTRTISDSRTLTSGTPSEVNTQAGGTGDTSYAGDSNTSASGTGNTGSGGPTTHTVTQSTYSPRYVTVIAASKD
jgi:hypothetical protein